MIEQEELEAVELELDCIWAREHLNHSVAEAFRISARIIRDLRKRVAELEANQRHYANCECERCGPMYDNEGAAP